MKLLPALAFACLLGRAAAQPLGPASIAAPQNLSPGTTTSATAPALSTADAQTLTQNSKTLLDERDRKDALADAEAAVEAGGGAGAYAARADAKLALNLPEEALMDYAEAARRDPARFGKKYEDFRARLEPRGQKSIRSNSRTPGGFALVIVKLLALLGVVLLVVAVRLLRRKQSKSGSEF